MRQITSLAKTSRDSFAKMHCIQALPYHRSMILFVSPHIHHHRSTRGALSRVSHLSCERKSRRSLSVTHTDERFTMDVFGRLRGARLGLTRSPRPRSLDMRPILCCRVNHLVGRHWLNCTLRNSKIDTRILFVGLISRWLHTWL